MIIIRLFGGLGNQLFQYAAARALAARHEVDLKYDVSCFKKKDTLRDFDLAKLGLPGSIASQEEISRLRSSSLIHRIKERILPYRFRRFYKEPHFHYDPSFFRLGENVYLQGYFQSEKYFLSIEKPIREQFRFDHLISADVKNYGEFLRKNNSVALHIRRGDYKNPEALKVHGILPLAYYRRAIELIKEKHADATFYLFSDEPSSAIEELELQGAVVVSGEKSKTHFEDIYLMSHCCHNIIANSSFSWWAAWLNRYDNKIVIAPKQWFGESTNQTQDLLPPAWLKT